MISTAALLYLGLVACAVALLWRSGHEDMALLLVVTTIVGVVLGITIIRTEDLPPPPPPRSVATTVAVPSGDRVQVTP